ncbi:hypothetical protein D3C79_432490 [compost metagenome]
MHKQPLAALGILEPQLIEALALMGLGAERHLGLAGRQRSRRDIVGVIGTPGDDRLVRIPMQEIHHHFLADTWDGQHPPALPGPRLGHADPTRAVVVAFTVAVPQELQADAAELITVDFFPGWPHHHRDLWAVH